MDPPTRPTAVAPSRAKSEGGPPDERDVYSELGGRIAQYELIRPLGRGGMGTVYLARDTRLGRLIALKLVRARRALGAERFRIEARATARCVHENIVVIHEIGEQAGFLFMALEYLPGLTLRQWLERRRVRGDAMPLPLSRVVEIMLPVARAIECAHGHGIVHRDLKPSNIMLTDTGLIKVLDFGVAKLFGQAEGDVDDLIFGQGSDPGRELTGDGFQVGSKLYMSPEQRGAGDVDGKSDIWAAGLILYELCTGRHPLRDRRGLDEVTNLDVPIPRVSDLRNDAGRLGLVIDRCLLKKKADRLAGAAELRGALESLARGPTGRLRTLAEGEACPYAGLAAFQESDADRFFGRARDVAYAAVLLREQPLVAVVGPSGAGKSSFVRAGVAPALKASGDGWESLVLRPGRRPMAALAALLIDDASTGDATAETDREALAAKLRVEPGHLGSSLRARARRRLSHTLVFVDQFEELYTLGADADERRAFAACLLATADDAASPLRVVIAVRSDFLDRLTELPELMGALTGGLFLLPALAREGLKESLTRPLEQVGFRFESEAMVDDMLAALEGTRSALPLLQFTASKLWDARDRQRQVLSEASYRAIGGVAGTLASHADAVLAGMPAADQALARAVFERLVTPERTRALAGVRELVALADRPEDAERVIARLVEARLIAVETDEREGKQAELVHESLIERWPTLGRWLDEHEEDAAFLARLREAARHWAESGRPRGLLWREEAMHEARRASARLTSAPRGVEGEFLAAVFGLARQNLRRRRGLAISLLVTMVVVAGAMSFLAWRESKASEEARAQSAASRRAAAETREEAQRARDAARLASARDLAGDPTRAAALLREVEAPAAHHAWAAQAASLARQPLAQVVLDGHDGIVWTAAFSGDGKRVVTASGNAAWIWDVDGMSAPVVLRGHGGPVWRAQFSPDGTRVMTASWDRSVRVWDVHGKAAPVVMHQPDRISWAAFSPDGSKIATASWDRTAWIWNANGEGTPVVLRGHGERIRRVEWSPDGTRVVTASLDGTARVWQADGSGNVLVLRGHAGAVWTAAFSPDGQLVATGGADNSARLWPVGLAGGAPTVLRGHTGLVMHVAFAGDGRLVTASADDSARVWPVGGRGPSILLGGHEGDVYMASFSRDGRRVVTASGDKTARVWSSDGSGLPTVLAGHELGVMWAEPDAAGERVVTAGADRAARVWRATQPAAPRVWAGPPRMAAEMDFTPDGRRVLLAWAGEKEPALWPVDGAGEPIVLRGHTAEVQTAEVSVDGRVVVTASDDGSARVWPIDGGRPVVLDAKAGPLTEAALSRDGRRVVTGGVDGTLRVWDVASASVVRVVPGRGQRMERIVFSPDGTRLLSYAHDDAGAQLHAIDSEAPPLVFIGHGNVLHWAEFSPDGSKLVTCSADNTARVWSSLRPDEVVVLAGHTHEVRRASFSPDGRRVVTASDDGTARVWSVDGPSLAVLGGYDNVIYRARWSSDGLRVVTSSEDVVRVWSADGRGVPIVLAGHTGRIASVDFAPDGEHVASVAVDGTARLWPDVREIPTLENLQGELWRATGYCMSVSERRERLGESEAAAKDGLASCARRVAGE